MHADFFFFKDTAPTEIYPLSLPAALPTSATGLVCDPSVPVSSAANCMATVTDSVATAPFPTGLVNFFADGAATSFASCSLSGSGVTQSCSVSYTPTTAGAHSIVAKYAGDSAHADSTSPPAAVAATKHPTATGLVCDPSVPVSSAANCMATVTDSVATRSEERRAGKECRSRWAPHH